MKLELKGKAIHNMITVDYKRVINKTKYKEAMKLEI
jgi:hypothetical protein